jgi:hypothetical protein
MRLNAVLGIAAAIFLSSCATNPLQIPPRPHALPHRPRPAEQAAVPESRPAAVPSGFDEPAGDDGWRAGDGITFELEFEDGTERHVFWLVMEVIRTGTSVDGAPRALVKTTLYDREGTELGVSRRRIDPQRIADSSTEILEAYNGLVNAAVLGEAPEKIQDTIDEEMTEGSAFDDARSLLFRELKKTVGARFVRDTLKDPAIKASIGSISVFDLAMAAVSPIEVLVDVNQLAAEQAAVEDFADIPASRPIRVPFVFTVGGAIHFRFAVTLTRANPPYALTGGLLELAGVNEARGDRRFLVRVVSAKRGDVPESRPASRPDSRPESRPD